MARRNSPADSAKVFPHSIVIVRASSFRCSSSNAFSLNRYWTALARRSLAPSGKGVGSGGDGPSDFGGGRKRNTCQQFGGGGIHHGQRVFGLRFDPTPSNVVEEPCGAHHLGRAHRRHPPRRLEAPAHRPCQNAWQAPSSHNVSYSSWQAQALKLGLRNFNKVFQASQRGPWMAGPAGDATDNLRRDSPNKWDATSATTDPGCEIGWMKEAVLVVLGRQEG